MLAIKPDPCRFDKGALCCSRGHCNTYIFHESDWIDHGEAEKHGKCTHQHIRETSDKSYSTDNEYMYIGTIDDHEHSISNVNETCSLF